MAEITQDITERKQAEMAIHETELRYRTVANFTYDWEYWQALDGGFHYVSPSCERITGYTVSDFVDHPDLLEEIILPDDRSIWGRHRHERETVFDRHHSLCQYAHVSMDSRLRRNDITG